MNQPLPLLKWLLLACCLLPQAAYASPADTTTSLPAAQIIGQIEQVAAFYGAMPTGVSVSPKGRIFTNFPRWGDPVEFTCAEVKDGKPLPYPSREINQLDQTSQAKCLVSVQSVVVDAKDRLWILDTGSIQFGPTSLGGPKLVGVNLDTNQVFQTILFPQDVALPTSYLNDVRFDLERGEQGMAFITDSSKQGPNGIVVVDLASGRSWRRLNDHPSTRPEKDFAPIVEGRQLLSRPKGQPPSPLHTGSDGLALGAKAERLYYCPLSSRHLYSVSVEALADPRRPEEQVAATVRDHGEKGASDGLESDAQGRIYVTDYEHNAIHRYQEGKPLETLVYDPRVLWPDTLSLAADGYLYFSANQLHRQPGFHEGQDLRQKPYSIFRVQVEAGTLPAGLKPDASPR